MIKYAVLDRDDNHFSDELLPECAVKENTIRIRLLCNQIPM